MNNLSSSRLKRTLIYILAILTVTIFLFPIIYALILSFQREQTLLSGFTLIFTPSLTNWREIFEIREFGRYLMNSTVIGLVTATINIILGAPAGYSLARLKLRSTRGMAYYMLIARMAPPIVMAIPFFLIMNRLGILGTRIAVMLSHILFTLAFSIWIMKNFFEQISITQEEAAFLSGASVFQTLWYVVFPQALPGVFATYFLSFVFSWNEFLYAFILSNRATRTIPSQVATFQSQVDVSYGGLAAVVVLAVIPTLIGIFIGQKYLLYGFAGSLD